MTKFINASENITDEIIMHGLNCKISLYISNWKADCCTDDAILSENAYIAERLNDDLLSESYSGHLSLDNLLYHVGLIAYYISDNDYKKYILDDTKAAITLFR